MARSRGRLDSRSGPLGVIETPVFRLMTDVAVETVANLRVLIPLSRHRSALCACIVAVRPSTHASRVDGCAVAVLPSGTAVVGQGDQDGFPPLSWFPLAPPAQGRSVHRRRVRVSCAAHRDRWAWLGLGRCVVG